MTVHEFFVRGIPAPQGSKIRTRYGMREASDKVGPWREAVVGQIIRVSLADLKLDGPLYVECVFYFERPKAHYGTKKGIPYLRDNAPVYVSRTPDIDKIQRSTYDALTQSGLIEDDSLIVVNYNEQLYCNAGDLPGAKITVKTIEVITIGAEA